MFKRSHLPAWGMVVVVLSALVFLPGLSGGFFLDDYANIVDNPRIHAESLDMGSLKNAAGAYDVGALSRPLSTLTFAVDHAIWGKAPFGYKLSSLLVHLLNTVLVVLLLWRLLSESCTPKAAASIAALAGLAWAAHPLQVSTVLYVVQRMEMLAATFVLLALLAYLRGRRLQIAGKSGLAWLLGSVVLAGMGLLAKESAVAFAPMALALELTVLQFQAGSPRVSRILRWAFAVAALVAIALFFGWVLPRMAPEESFAGRSFNQYERVITQFRVLPMYLSQMLVPMPDAMPVYYDNFAKSTGLLSPWTTLAGALFLSALLGSAWHLRRRAPLAALGIFWFFAAHALTSSPLNLELAFEHRNYLALLGVVLVVTDAVLRIPMRDGPNLKVFAAIVVVLLFAGLATIRSATWGDPLLMASDLAARNPDSVRASNDLATIYVNYSDGNPASPFMQFAIDEFKRSSRLPNSGPFPEQGLILISSMAGQPADAAWWDALQAKIETQPIGPEHVMAITGMLEQHRGGFTVDRQRLAKVYQALLDRRERWPGHVLANFADFVFEELKDGDRATGLYVRAVTDNPRDPDFAHHLLSTLIQEGRGTQARAVAETMQSLNLMEPQGGAESPK